MMEYRSDRLVWKARTPDDFPRNRDPAKMCRGWNRAYEGQPVSITPTSKHSPWWGSIQFRWRGDKYAVTAEQVYLLVAGVQLPIPPHVAAVRRESDVAAGVLERVFERGPDRTVVWKRRDMVVAKELEALAKNSAHRGAGNFVATESGVRTFNRIYAGKPVAVNRDGFLTIAGTLRVRWDVVAVLLWDRAVPPQFLGKVRAPARPVPDTVLRALFYLDAEHIVRWKPRGDREWELLVLHGILKRMPDEKGRMMWDRRCSGKPILARASIAMNVSVHGKCVQARKIYQLLKGI